MKQILRLLPPLAAVLVAAELAHLLNLTAALGAHPWWAGKVIWLGALPGLAVALAAGRLQLPRWLTAGGFAAFGAAAFAVASTGKARFAASYAEDLLAGQFWYFGWIAVCMLAAAALATVARPAAQAR
ncbi:hypothetical protein [Leisingera sp. ANG-M1]|uniref:hypothetical protein n=1 Tax=Leisingera sp. ANG-M1 TaxID=1577895 RepID=UPI0006905526|nr:hypothetical protein [Leisingera sp. ANG-M1]